MKTFSELSKNEKLAILEALIDGKSVESYSLYYSNDELLRGWQSFTLPINNSAILRIKEDD